MTYNIEGLPWPARKGRRPFLRAITAEFQRMEQLGVLPDVIVFQEAFSSQALQTAASTPHSHFVTGPRAAKHSGLSKTSDPVLRKRNYLRGEWGIRFMGSGLAIASRFPILGVYRQPYGPSSCAGWDCLANKSAMLVQIAVPEVRLQLHALAYNLAIFLRCIELPETMADWSLTSLQLKLIKIGARVVRHARAITFQLAEVAVTGPMVRAILAAIRRLRAPPLCA